MGLVLGALNVLEFPVKVCW